MLFDYNWCVCGGGGLCGCVEYIDCVTDVFGAACAEGFYGPGCERRCQCVNGGVCLSVSGSCECPAGFIGARCHLSESHTAHTQ